MNAHHLWGIGILIVWFAVLSIIAVVKIISTYGWYDMLVALGISGIFVLGIWLCLKGDKKQERDNGY